MRHATVKRLFFFVLMGANLALAGCGIKPGTLEPPAGANKQSYPKTYPKPSNPPPAPAPGTVKP